MASVVYILCALTSGLCTVLLLLRYRRGGARLLFWSGLCFLAFTINNILLFADLVLFPTAVNLLPWRNGTMTAGLALLIYGLLHRGSEP